MKEQMMMRIGIAGGIISVILGNIHAYELVKTAMLAAVGTVVSFGMSALLHKIAKRRFRDPSSK